MSATYDEVMASLGLQPSDRERPCSNGSCTGDRAAYQRHTRRGELACAESLAAHNAYMRDYLRMWRRRTNRGGGRR